mmetsp:Transcript_16523/g.42046  ORF Transcript_16523/g.42046 Transcript_16523/m.42046 type:complete len:229 (-) Transcript_16523:121-807(-)
MHSPARTATPPVVKIDFAACLHLCFPTPLASTRSSVDPRIEVQKMREAARQAEAWPCGCAAAAAAGAAVAPEYDTEPRSPSLRAPLKAVAPSLVDRVIEGVHIPIALHDRHLHLASLAAARPWAILVAPELRLEEERALLAEGGAHGEVDIAIPSIILVGMQVAPILAVAVVVHKRSHGLQPEEMHQLLQDLPQSGRRGEGVVGAQSDVPGKRHAAVEPHRAEVQLPA